MSIEFNGFILTETVKAVLVEPVFGEVEVHWVPKSQSTINGDRFSQVNVKLTDWLSNQWVKEKNWKENKDGV